MGSRIRENPERLFELFVEVARPDVNTEPFILQSFPTGYSDRDVLKSISKFAFPCHTDTSTVDHFTFVLTDIESMYRFGFCRHATGAQTCLCFVSFLPWYEIFYNFLNYLAELLNQTGCTVDTILQVAYDKAIPPTNVPVTIISDQQMFSFTSPDSTKLSTIPETRNLTEYYTAIDTYNMVKIFASMLNERRILVVSRKLSRLTACVHAAAGLLYPMYWQHLYIPVMPQHLLDYCSAPMPYIIGVHSSLYAKLRASDLGDAVVIDADKNTVESEFDDLNDMPSDVISSLKKSLRFHHNDPKKSSPPLGGDALPMAFLKALVKLIGGYRDALRFRHGEPITFDPVAFVQTRPEHMQPFLEKVLHLQIFQQFIHDRLDLLNCGQGFNDLFENEATLLGDKLNAQSRYKEWSTNMKKQGKRFQKGGKVVWSRLQKRVRTQGHKAYKGIRNRIGNLSKEDEHTHPHNIGLNTLDGGAVIYSRARPARPTKPNRQAYSMVTPNSTLPRSSSSGDKPLTRKSSVEKTSKQYRLLTLEEKSLDDSNADLDYNRVSINLINDPDIQRAIRRSLSMEDVHSNLQDSSDSLASSNSSDGRLDAPVFAPSTQYGQLIEELEEHRINDQKLTSIQYRASVIQKSLDKPPEIMTRSYNHPHQKLESVDESVLSTSMIQDRPERPPPRRPKIANPEKNTKDNNDKMPVPPPRHRRPSDKTQKSQIDQPSLIRLDSTDSESEVVDDKSKRKSVPPSPLFSADPLQPESVVKSRRTETVADLFDPLSLGNRVRSTTVGSANGKRDDYVNGSNVKNGRNAINSESVMAEIGSVSISNIQQKLLNNHNNTPVRPFLDQSIQNRNTQRLIQSYTLPKSVNTTSPVNPLYNVSPRFVGTKPGNPFVETRKNPFLSTQGDSELPRQSVTVLCPQKSPSNIRDPFDDLVQLKSADDTSARKWETFD